MAGELAEPKANQLENQEEMLQLLEYWISKMEMLQVWNNQLMDKSIELFEATQLKDVAIQGLAESDQDPGLLRQVEKESQEVDMLYQEIEEIQGLMEMVRRKLEVVKLVLEYCRIKGFKN
ncbi:hypothetical protein EMPG_10080 [Blastomyces silverae]|uniref:Uncharacterized protein n=1 Tax=Blastomyces silverae TaxID=2060906 RepID=A0A0H1B688_9EURO|nr:hypothetical protein EMPG_10080 [Blastomyces silverae]